MNLKAKALTTALIGILSITALTGCKTESADVKARNSLQDQSQSNGQSLELANLKEKRSREDDPNAQRYLYIYSFGQPIGYYVTKGKVSSNGSQIAPEQDLIRPYNESSERYVVDSAQDDGSFGDGDPGIFFFTADGTMVVTSLDYIQSDAPLPLNVPELKK